MKYLRNYYWTLIAVFAGSVATFGSAYGAEVVDAAHQLQPCVEYIGEKVGTLHTDMTLYATSGVAATKEGVSKLKDKVHELNKNLKNILDPENGLEAEVKTAKDAAHDAKNKIKKLSERNSELVDQIKSLQSKTNDMQDHVDDLDIKMKDGNFRGNGRKDIGQKVLDQGKEDGWVQNGQMPAGKSFQVRL